MCDSELRVSDDRSGRKGKQNVDAYLPLRLCLDSSRYFLAETGWRAALKMLGSANGARARDELFLA